MHWVGNPPTRKQLYCRGAPMRVRVLSPMPGFTAWDPGIRTRMSQNIWLWKPIRLDGRNPTGLGEIKTPFLEDTHKALCALGPREEPWLHRSLGQNYFLVLEGLLGRQGAAMIHCGDKDTGGRGTMECLLSWALLEVTTLSPRPGTTQHPVGSTARPLQAKQPVTQEYSPHPLSDKLPKIFLTVKWR